MSEALSAAAARTAAAEQGAAPGQGLAHIELSIGDMTCPHCPPAVEKALGAVTGVREVHVNLANALASIDYDEAQVKVGALLRAIRSVGYAAATAKIRIPIQHMHCSSCVTRIELALKLVSGVVAARANLGTNAVDVEYLPDQTSFDALRQAIDSAGHRVAEPEALKAPEAQDISPEEAAQQAEYRTLMRKFWFAAIVSVPVMALSYPDFIPGVRDWMPPAAMRGASFGRSLACSACRSSYGPARSFSPACGTRSSIAPPTCTR